MSFKIVDPPADPDDIKFPETDMIKKNKAECAAVSKMGQKLEYEESFWDQKEKVFEYYRSLNPASFYMNADQFFRVKDRDTGKEYLFIHATKYCQSREVTGDQGTNNTGLVENPYIKPHQIDGYWGMHKRPIVAPKSYNPNGTVKEWFPRREIIVYDWLFHDEKTKKPTPFYEIYNSKENRFKTRNFYIGFINTDPSKWGMVSESEHKYQVYNEKDFADYSFEDTWDLARSGFATENPSMETWLASKAAVEQQRISRLASATNTQYAKQQAAIEKTNKSQNL